MAYLDHVAVGGRRKLQETTQKIKKTARASIFWRLFCSPHVMHVETEPTTSIVFVMLVSEGEHSVQAEGTVACKKCGTETTNAWEFCNACPSLEEASWVVHGTDKEKRDSFLITLHEQEVPIEKLLKFTREDDALLRELGLTKVGQRHDLYEWLAKRKGL